MEARAQSDYRKYSNEELHEMIKHLAVNRIISEELKNKMTDSIFKRHHDKLSDDQERREAQKRNALQWYYRKKLIRMWPRFQEHKEELEYIGGELDDYAYLSIEGAIKYDEYIKKISLLNEELEDIKNKIRNPKN